MPILLNEEGIGEALGIGWNYLPDEVRSDAKKISLAQLKNVVEWGQEICLEHGHKNRGGKARRECYKCWQAIGKEAGL